MDLLLKASKTLKPYSKDLFLLAVSGGADSMALLTIFMHMKEHFSFSFSVGHIHHGEGFHLASRDRAQEFVKEFCDENGIEFHSRRYNGEELKSEKELRDYRYEALHGIREQVGAQWIALAHHRQDLLETRLMRLIRGTGIQGLEAMSLESSPLMRPLLDISSKELRKLLTLKKVTWSEDLSNQNNDPFRNWLRNHWLPQLEEKRPGSLGTLSRSLDLMQAIRPAEFSCIQGDEILISEFLTLQTESKKQALALYMKNQGLKDYGQSHINEILKRLDCERKDLTFHMLRHEWRVNAGRMKVLGLG